MTNDDGPVLDQINLVVHDMDSMSAFYQRLGFEIRFPPGPWAAHHRNTESAGRVDVDLDSGVFASMWNTGWAPDRAGVVIGFRVSSRQAVDDLYDELVAEGHVGQQPPYDAFWGARYAVVEDPDGNAVGLMSPADPSYESPPPEPPAS
jgi:predicted lactoylglutathione lyase